MTSTQSALAKSRKVVDAFNAIFGVHAGFRTVHAKGCFLRGEFTATPSAARLTRAPHMQGKAVPVIARFSNGSGFPAMPDFLPDIRGFAVSFQLPGGQRTDLVAASLPRFPVRSPDGFLALVDALRPRITLPLHLLGFLLRHPEILRSLPANFLALLRLPAGYDCIGYHAIHAFKWISPYGSERFVRYRWLPEEERRISWLRAVLKGRNYLQAGLVEHLREGPIRLRLQVQIARPGDPVSDATAVWPEDRETVIVGTLELQALEERDESLVFDPLRLCDGIGPSRDPLLTFRTQAYAVSAERRGAVHKPRHVRAA